jgi:hypothetical protein
MLHVGVWCVTTFAAVYLIKVAGEQGLLSVAYVAAGLAIAAWILFSGKLWWALTPMAVAFGGTLLLGYKIYPHEMALLISIVALLPLIALRRRDLPLRPPLPWTIYALLALFIVDWAISIYVIEDLDLHGIGSLSRAYISGLWAIIFGLLFYRYGELNPRQILRLLYIVFCLRSIVVGTAALVETFLPLPKIGFVLSGLISGFTEYRVAGIQLGLLAFAYATMERRVGVKLVHYAVAAVAIWMALLGGGRVTIGITCCALLMWAILRRQWGWLSLLGAMGLALVVLLNRSPEMLYHLPKGGQRALSILVTESSTRWLDWHDRNRISNQWHRHLSELGWQRWTENPATFLFGNRVEPYDESYEARSATWQMKADIGAKMGLYEAGLWTVLGLIGLVGLLLYLGLFVFLLKGPLALVRREGICSPTHVLAFLALLGAMLWGVFSWIVGHFPSYELMMAVLAKAAYEDRRREQARVADVSATPAPRSAAP